MPVCGNYLFFELPKKIVLNPKDGCEARRLRRAAVFFSIESTFSTYFDLSLQNTKNTWLEHRYVLYDITKNIDHIAKNRFLSTLYALSFRRYCSVDAFVLGLGQNRHKQTEEYKEVLLTMKDSVK